MSYPRWEIVSGVHVNIGLNLDVIRSLYLTYFNDEYDSTKDFANAIYAKIAQGFLAYRWLITLLFGASPYVLENYFDPSIEDTTKYPVRSLRSSDVGFTNENGQKVSYSSVEKYASDIQKLVDEGEMIRASGFHGLVRFKGEEVSDLTEKGAKYLEIRMFDVNPFINEGVNNLELEFVEMLFAYLLMTEAVVPKDDVDGFIKAAMYKNNKVALENPLERSEFADEAIEFLQGLKEFAKENLFIDIFSDVLIDRINNPKNSIAGMIVETSRRAGSFENFILKQAEDFKILSHQNPAGDGFADLPTRAKKILQDAFKQSDKVRLLDRQTGTFEIIHDGESYILAGDQLIHRYQNND
jgi:gamma-glutamylcysteine synthetase